MSAVPAGAHPVLLEEPGEFEPRAPHGGPLTFLPSVAFFFSAIFSILLWGISLAQGARYWARYQSKDHVILRFSRRHSPPLHRRQDVRGDRIAAHAGA